MLLIDGNARVGSHPAGSVGHHQPEKETSNGAFMRQVMDTFELCAVNTHFPAGWTWQSTRKTTSRIDYVAIHSHLLPKVKACRADEDVLLGTGLRIDHRPVLCEVSLGKKKKDDHDSPRKKFSLNRQALKDKNCCDHFAQALSRFRRPRNATIDQWQEKLNRFIVSQAKQSNGRPADAPRKSWVSSGTWCAMRWKAPTFRMVHATRGEYRH